jgi:hypothetical protein
LLQRRAPPYETEYLRLRITRRLSGSIDGIQLDRFRSGLTYEVGTCLGSYLLALGVAEPAADDSIAIVLPPEQQMFGPVPRGHGYRPPAPRAPVAPLVRAIAADRPPRRRQNNRRKKSEK